MPNTHSSTMKLYDINSSELNNQNSLLFNSSLGILSSNYSEELSNFLSTMKLHHINSFLGGTITVEKLNAPLLVYRTGNIGKFWTTTPPTSPWQHSLEMAMHPSIYPAHMKEISNFHPANQSVLMYQIPAGEVIASGITAPQGSFPGMGSQIFLPTINAEQVRFASWTQWKDHHHSPLAYTTTWNSININGLQFKIENTNAQQAIFSTVPRMFKNPSKTFQTVLEFAKDRTYHDQLTCYAFDLSRIENNAAAVTYLANNGHYKIALQTQNALNLYRDVAHELTHATLPLANPHREQYDWEQSYVKKMRTALCTDYWDYNKNRNSVAFAPIQQRVADWVFHQPQSYPIHERFAERLAFGVQSIAESERALKRPHAEILT